MQKDLKGSNFNLAFQPLGDLNLEASLNPFKPIKYVYFEEGFVKMSARLADIGKHVFLKDGFNLNTFLTHFGLSFAG